MNDSLLFIIIHYHYLAAQTIVVTVPKNGLLYSHLVVLLLREACYFDELLFLMKVPTGVQVVLMRCRCLTVQVIAHLYVMLVPLSAFIVLYLC